MSFPVNGSEGIWVSRYNYTSCNYGASARTTLEKLGLRPNTDNIAAQKTPQSPPSLTLHSRSVWDTLAEAIKSALLLETEI